jgi:hypothetical protein
LDGFREREKREREGAIAEPGVAGRKKRGGRVGRASAARQRPEIEEALGKKKHRAREHSHS